MPPCAHVCAYNGHLLFSCTPSTWSEKENASLAIWVLAAQAQARAHPTPLVLAPDDRGGFMSPPQAYFKANFPAMDIVAFTNFYATESKR